MPKVYMTQAQRDRESNKRRIKSFLKMKMGLEDIKQKDIARELGLTQAAVSAMINNGSITLLQFLKLTDLLNIHEDDFKILIGG